MFNVGQQVKIEGFIYNVIQSESLEEMVATYPNTAKLMQQKNATHRLLIQKPKGKKFYQVWANSQGFSSPTGI